MARFDFVCDLMVLLKGSQKLRLRLGHDDLSILGSNAARIDKSSCPRSQPPSSYYVLHMRRRHSSFRQLTNWFIHTIIHSQFVHSLIYSFNHSFVPFFHSFNQSYRCLRWGAAFFAGWAVAGQWSTVSSTPALFVSRSPPSRHRRLHNSVRSSFGSAGWR